VAGLFIGGIALSGIVQTRPGAAGAANVTLVPSLDEVQSVAPVASEQPSPEPTAEPTPTAAPTIAATATPEITVPPPPPPPVAPKPSCSKSGHFGDTLSACGVDVTVSISEDTSSDMTPVGDFTQPYSFIITAIFTDPAMGTSLTPSLNSGDNSGYYWFPDSMTPMVSGVSYRMVIYGRPGVAPKLWLGFSLKVVPTFSFS
jgi:hypothetical protein